jgi:hypothetical protein
MPASSRILFPPISTNQALAPMSVSGLRLVILKADYCGGGPDAGADFNDFCITAIIICCMPS